MTIDYIRDARCKDCIFLEYYAYLKKDGKVAKYYKSRCELTNKNVSPRDLACSNCKIYGL